MKIPEGWPTEEMIEAAKDARLTIPEGALPGQVCRIIFEAMWNAAPTPPARSSTTLPPTVLYALRFYANGEHFYIDDDAQEFDTVSGEPVNWLHSEKDNDCTMIEDGGLAKAVLQGMQILIDDDDKSTPVEGEIYSSAKPAQEAEPVGEVVKFGDGPWGEIYKSYINVPSGIKLYTHAPSDELRQAAEELIKAYEDGDETYLYNAVQDLRTELKGE